MPENALEGRTADDIARQADGRSVKVGLYLDLFPLGLFINRFQIHVLREGFTAALVNASNCRADLTVLVKTQILLQEIDQPSFSLQNGEHLHRGLRIG